MVVEVLSVTDVNKERNKQTNKKNNQMLRDNGIISSKGWSKMTVYNSIPSYIIIQEGEWSKDIFRQGKTKRFYYSVNPAEITNKCGALVAISNF